MKKPFFLRAALLSLALALAIPGLAACGKKNPDTPETPSGSETEAESGISPLEKRDFNGKTFNVLLRTDYADEFAIYEETNTPVPDAVYARNQRLEDTYGLQFNFIDRADDWDHATQFAQTIHLSVLDGGETSYDFVIGAQSYIAFNIVNGDLMNLNDVPHLTFEGEWWGQQAVEALTVNGVCYQATGDFAVSMLESMSCVYFNKKLAEDNGVGDLYQTVRDGEWTHEEMVRISKDIYTDLDDGGIGIGDSFGLVMFQTDIRSAIVTYNTPTLTKEGEIIWNTSHTQSVVEGIVDAFNNHSGIYYCEGQNEAHNIFKAGRSMLMWGRLDSAADLRNMEQDFGIIPCPMFDASQGAYYTTSNEASMVCVPNTQKSLDDIGFVIEAICRESTDTVASVFYEKALKSRYAPDPESAEMIERIRKSLTYDLGWVYSTQISTADAVFGGNQYQRMMNDARTNFSGWYGGFGEAFDANVKTFFVFFGKSDAQ